LTTAFDPSYLEIMKRPALTAAPGALALVLLAHGTAWGALTSSEKGQVVSYVAEGRVGTAERVRALVARPDLSADESADALAAALTPLVFHEARAAYLHEVLYGPASTPSRSVLAVTVTRGLAARADAVLSRHEGDLDQDVASVAELSRIFAFLDSDVANAGQPHGLAHDPSVGIGASSYDDAAHALGGVIERHPRWLKGDALIPAAAEPVRAQLELAILDMANDTTSRRFEAAERLGLVGSRRATLIELGVLLLDDGHAESARVERIRALLARLGGARESIEAVALFDPRGALRARGDVVALRPPPAAVASFGDDVAAPAIDPELSGAARAFAEVLVHRALEAHPELRAQVEKDVAGVKGDRQRSLGAPDTASARSTPDAGSALPALVTAVQLLEIDAPTTIDLALVRLLGGYDDPALLLSDALGALAAFAPPAPGGTSLVLGHGRDATVSATNVRVAPAGFVTAFTLAGRTFTLARDGAGGLAAKRDGAPVALTMLDSARAPVSVAPVWSGGGLVFAKLAGTPRAGVSPGGRVRLIADGRGVDAIATAASGDDVAVEANVEPAGEVAIVVRAAATPAGFKGVALVIDVSGSPGRASIRAWDDAGKLTELAPPVDLPAAPKYAVRVAVRGTKLEAQVGAITLHADVPPALARGDVALAARHGSTVEATGWTVKRP
jgi:hypothetical protein